MIFGISTAGNSQQIEESEELARIRERMKTTLISGSDLKTSMDKLDRQLSENEKTASSVAYSIKKLEIEIRKATKQVTRMEQDQKRILKIIDKYKQDLIQSTRSAYAAGSHDWLKLLLNQEDPSRLSRILAYYNYINRARNSQILNLKREIESEKKIRGQIVQEQEKLNQSRATLLNQEKTLNATIKSRRQLIAKLDFEIKENDAEYARLSENARQLEELLGKIANNREKSNVDMAQGAEGYSWLGTKTSCPLPDSLVATVNRQQGNGEGILIPAAEGTQVMAAADGEVVFADWMRGYGMLLIIRHQNGAMSLYAFNQSLYKRVGERVSTGESIAAVGSSGGRKEPALFFGLRQQGRAMDPGPLCRDSH